jgi:hypothetical protein
VTPSSLVFTSQRRDFVGRQGSGCQRLVYLHQLVTRRSVKLGANTPRPDTTVTTIMGYKQRLPLSPNIQTKWR